MAACCERALGDWTHLWLVLLADVGSSGQAGTNRGRASSTSREDGRLGLDVGGGRHLEVGSVELGSVVRLESAGLDTHSSAVQHPAC